MAYENDVGLVQLSFAAWVLEDRCENCASIWQFEPCTLTKGKGFWIASCKASVTKMAIFVDAVVRGFYI